MVHSNSGLLSPEQMITLLQVNTLGMSVLTETIKSAAFYMNNTYHMIEEAKFNKSYVSHFKMDMREGRQSLAFINGTGLEIMLDSYCLDFNADRLRSGFFYLMRKETNGHSKS